MREKDIYRYAMHLKIKDNKNHDLFFQCYKSCTAKLILWVRFASVSPLISHAIGAFFRWFWVKLNL